MITPLYMIHSHAYLDLVKIEKNQLEDLILFKSIGSGVVLNYFRAQFGMKKIQI